MTNIKNSQVKAAIELTVYQETIAAVCDAHSEVFQAMCMGDTIMLDVSSYEDAEDCNELLLALDIEAGSDLAKQIYAASVLVLKA